MASKTVTLYIDDTSLRLMVTQGKQIKEWAESPLEPGLVENNVVIKEAELAAKIKQLFKVQKVKTKKIVLGLSGIRCLTRPISFPRLPKEMVGEAVRREAQRVLPVPLEELYLSWQAIPAPEEQSQVFIVAIPRQAMDVLYKAVEQAGLKPSFMEVKPILLAGIIKEKTAIIVDVQATEFDIVIMSDGVPQPVRSMRFASGALSAEEKLNTIKSELTRTLTFYNSNNPEKALAASVPVSISGELASRTELHQSLSTEVGHPVQSLLSPLEYPEGLDPSHFMANIGLAYQTLSSKEKTGATVVNLNALPSVYQTKAVSLINVLAIPGAVLAVGILVFLIILVQSTAANITSLKIRLDNTNQSLQQRQAQRQEMTKKVEELQSKINGMITLRDNLKSVLGVLEKEAAAIDKDLAVATESVPSQINLSNINRIGDVVTITGKSLNERQILLFITALGDSGRFGNIIITDMTRAGVGEIDFTLVGNLKTKGIGASSMEVALGSLPAGVNLTDVDSSKEGVLAVSGIATNADKIFAYLRALEASEKFKEITIISMTRNTDGGMTFSLVLKS